MKKKSNKKKKVADPIEISSEWTLSDRNESWEKLWKHLVLFLSQEINEENRDGR